MPPHLGHISLIERALGEVDRLTILVCTQKREPIPGILRFQWMQELAARAHVLHVTDENPSEPQDHPRFWDIWVETIRRVLPAGPDVVFTGEPYGKELARRLGAEHVMVDRTRSAFRVSATEIRDRPLAQWRFLPPPVRPFFAKRVVVSGSESTGKTMLARNLAQRYQTVWVPESVRGYLDTKPSPLDASDIGPIAKGQLASEEAISRGANRVVILDTDLLSTEIYATHYYGHCPDWIRVAAGEKSADLYLLCDIDVPWVPDPQRDRPHLREHIHELFRTRLAASGRPVVMLSGSWEERFRTACAAIEEMLRSAEV